AGRWPGRACGSPTPAPTAGTPRPPPGCARRRGGCPPRRAARSTSPPEASVPALRRARPGAPSPTSGSCHPLHGPEPRAAGPGIAFRRCVGCLPRPPGQDPEGALRATGADREPGGTGAAPLEGAEGLLHGAVLEAVKGDDRRPAADAKQPRERAEDPV